jgi:hypothetical protein
MLTGLPDENMEKIAKFGVKYSQKIAIKSRAMPSSPASNKSDI